MLSATMSHTEETSLAQRIRDLESQGYAENLVPEFDRFSCRSGEQKLYPSDFCVDEIIRFDDSSDPDGQSILYAISSEKNDIKGLYVESYGLHHDSLSQEMLDRIRTCELAIRKQDAPDMPEKAAWL